MVGVLGIEPRSDAPHAPILAVILHPEMSKHSTKSVMFTNEGVANDSFAHPVDSLCFYTDGESAHNSIQFYHVVRPTHSVPPLCIEGGRGGHSNSCDSNSLCMYRGGLGGVVLICARLQY